MKVYLDDERQAPTGWVQCRWPEEVIQLLQTERVEVISLDHDLGEVGPKARTGMTVLKWLEDASFHNPQMHVPKILIHTANSVERPKMYAARDNIYRWTSK